MKRRTKPILSVLLAVLALLFLYTLLFGKLFPFSPFLPGFATTETTRAEVCIQRGASFPDPLQVDTLFPRIEACLGLTFKDKPRIFVFRDEGSFRRRSLSRARFCALYNGDIVCAPRAMAEAEQGEISLAVYLRHELTHSLIHQQTGLIRAARFPKWLHEGTAMVVAGQMGTGIYPSREETIRAIRAGNFLPPALYHTRHEKAIRLDVEQPIAFLYSEFGCLVEFLVAQHGKEKYLDLVRTLLGGRSSDQAFEEVYGRSLESLVEDFRTSVAAGPEPNE